MPITNAVVEKSGITLLSRWTWQYDQDGQMGVRRCGDLSALVFDARDGFHVSIWDDRTGDTLYESELGRTRPVACSMATSMLRGFAERKPTHRMVPS
jgi:hypothetical protein